MLQKHKALYSTLKAGPPLHTSRTPPAKGSGATCTAVTPEASAGTNNLMVEVCHGWRDIVQYGADLGRFREQMLLPPRRPPTVTQQGQDPVCCHFGLWIGLSCPHVVNMTSHEMKTRKIKGNW